MTDQTPTASSAAYVEALRVALKPFADCAEELDGSEFTPRAPDGEWAKFRLLTDDYRRARAALSAQPPAEAADRVERDVYSLLSAVEGKAGWTAARVMEVRADGAGVWVPCSGCQESVEGQVSTKDYPYSAMFGCQPGSGCRECGGLGVIWDTTDYAEMAAWILADDERALAQAPKMSRIMLERQLSCAMDIDAVFCIDCGQPDEPDLHDPSRCPGIGGKLDAVTIAQALILFDKSCEQFPDLDDHGRALHCAMLAGTAPSMPSRAGRLPPLAAPTP